MRGGVYTTGSIKVYLRLQPAVSCTRCSYSMVCLCLVLLQIHYVLNFLGKVPRKTSNSGRTAWELYYSTITLTNVSNNGSITSKTYRWTSITLSWHSM